MTETQEKAIVAHGRNLLAIFPNAAEQDPVKLCKKLRNLELEAATIGLRLSNGPEYPGGDEEVEERTHNILAKVNNFLGNLDLTRLGKPKMRVPIFINRDPRGYALKIDDEWMRKHETTLERDWGGYGLIAPAINAKGE